MKNKNCLILNTYQKNTGLKKKVSEIADVLSSHYNSSDTIKKDGIERIPSKSSIVELIEQVQELMFPGYFGKQDIHSEVLRCHIGTSLHKLFDNLSEQISKSFRHRCSVDSNNVCLDCFHKGQEFAYEFIKKMPEIRKKLELDIIAAYDGDPAASNYDEIIFSYPGFKAVFAYRLANILYKLKIPLIPRIMSESAHSETGIDIHPGAEIGKRFFIDHGTGVVIGETTVIGDNVKIYQGVTLGALSIPHKKTIDNSEKKIIKRHPTIEDECVIYSGATILGGETVIGKGSVIGGNVWLTHSLKPYSKVMSKQFELNKISIKEVNEKNTDS